ncbi:Thiol-disulfide oxidoreductase resA (fragment) [Capnocytophaga canimorsus]
MARTPSNMLPLNTLAPDFKLLDAISNDEKTLSELKGEKATVIMFLCNHCPYVKHVNSALVALANDYQSKGIAFIAISSNDVVNYPEDSPELMQKTAQELAYPFVYLYDETQEVAKSL